MNGQTLTNGCNVTESCGTAIGDEDALIIEISKFAHKFARLEVKHRHDAEDLAQDIVLECLEKIRRGTWNAHPESLAAVVRWLINRRAISRLRSRRRREQREEEYLEQIVKSERAWMCPEVAIRERELTTLHQMALSRLTPACREAYLLVREGGSSYERVAAQLGIKRSTLNSHIATAQRRITAVLKSAGVPTAARRTVGRRPGGKKQEDTPMGAPASSVPN